MANEFERRLFDEVLEKSNEELFRLLTAGMILDGNIEGPLRSEWIEIGKENPWIRQADDPVFDVDSFGECLCRSHLIDRILHGNWCLGQAFFFRDLCFINQVNGGDEWLVIKGSVAFESFTCEAIGREDLEVIVRGFLECRDAHQCNQWLRAWNEGIRVYLDGKSWTAVRKENWMVPLPECPYGFGPTIPSAVRSLMSDEEIEMTRTFGLTASEERSAGIPDGES